MSADVFYHPCCYTTGLKLVYAAIKSEESSPADAIQGDEVIVTCAVTRPGPADVTRLSTIACSLFVLEAPFCAPFAHEPLSIDSRVAWWTLGEDRDISNRDPFDATIPSRIIVRMGVVVALGRLDIVYVLFDDEPAQSRVKRNELRRIVAQRSDANIASKGKRKDLIAKKLGLGDSAGAASTIRFAPQFAGVGHESHFVAPGLDDINNISKR